MTKEKQKKVATRRDWKIRPTKLKLKTITTTTTTITTDKQKNMRQEHVPKWDIFRVENGKNACPRKRQQERQKNRLSKRMWNKRNDEVTTEWGQQTKLLKQGQHVQKKITIFIFVLLFSAVSSTTTTTTTTTTTSSSSSSFSSSSSSSGFFSFFSFSFFSFFFLLV